MIKWIAEWLRGKRTSPGECARLHGKTTGKFVRLPASLRDLDGGYKALIQELGKR